MRPGVEVAQTALWFGVDDLDGTVQEEKIYHMAGARTPEAMTPREIERLIAAAGREPVERDTLYNVVGRTPDGWPRLAELRQRRVGVMLKVTPSFGSTPGGLAFSSAPRLRKVSQWLR